jgi:membrane-bound inhibitor of C-type lysozyme
MKTTTAIGVLIAFIVVVGGLWFISNNKNTGTTPPTNATSTEPLATVAFACAEGKSMGAAFYKDPNAVVLQLSDGRSMTLPQTQSASGIRYANADESFIFWGKGNTAFVQEGTEQNQTYTGCIVVAPDPTQTLSQIYATSTLGFTFRFPANYTVDQKYVYQALGPGKGIKGVKVTIPAAATTGTNLSKDTYVSVEVLPKATSCTANLFLDMQNGAKVSSFTDAGVEYSVATTTGAGAGNIYDEAVFAIPGSSPCTAVRYFIHSGNIGNYPAGSVTGFNKAGLINEFDNIRRSLVLGR